ncbi:MAG: hypothetical protein PHE89_06015 [Alphaproteobacteria bacterium]|nr:hypothetical protein [Alphaproteobacteria bacterium]
MKRLKTSFFCLSFSLATFICAQAKAQVFEGQEVATSQEKATTSSTANWFQNPRNKAAVQAPQAAAPVAQKNIKEKVEVKDPKNWQALEEQAAKPKLPQIDRPTLDGVERGRVSMVPVVTSQKGKPVDDSFIFVYYSNFNIRTTMSGSVACDVRFIVLSTLDRRINSLSFRLKWPKMDTALNYEGITPNTETYYDYTLLGEGCYSMDSTPNIIVNRCRVKNMTSQECASKIKWLRKS